jgi:hypothetical protein
LALDKPAILDILSCIPEIAKLEPKKVLLNLKHIKDYLQCEQTKVNQFLIDYPTVIANYRNIERIEFYMNLYFEMSKEEFTTLLNRFPLLFTADVNIK